MTTDAESSKAKFRKRVRNWFRKADVVQLVIVAQQDAAELERLFYATDPVADRMAALDVSSRKVWVMLE